MEVCVEAKEVFLGRISMTLHIGSIEVSFIVFGVI